MRNSNIGAAVSHLKNSIYKFKVIFLKFCFLNSRSPKFGDPDHRPIPSEFWWNSGVLEFGKVDLRGAEFQILKNLDHQRVGVWKVDHQRVGVSNIRKISITTRSPPISILDTHWRTRIPNHGSFKGSQYF